MLAANPGGQRDAFQELRNQEGTEEDGAVPDSCSLRDIPKAIDSSLITTPELWRELCAGERSEPSSAELDAS